MTTTASSSASAAGQRVSISKRVRDQVMNDRMSLIIQDALVDPRWKEQHSIISQGIRSLMAAPLQTDDRVIGMLYLDSGETSEFTTEDLELTTVMANIAAVRIEYQRLSIVERRRELLERSCSRPLTSRWAASPRARRAHPGTNWPDRRRRAAQSVETIRLPGAFRRQDRIPDRRCSR
ncbi:MAG: GAF domain-containing protein [Bryobacterales bacterium]